MNNITDVSSLSNLDNLVDLDVSWNFITDLKPLAKIKNLQYLFIQSNNLTNIQALKDAKKLVQISLSDNFIDDQETIQYFLDRGVAIYGLDEQHQQIEHETLLPLFPESKGYEIKKDGSISIDLSKQENKQAAKLDTEQVEMLIKNRKPLIIYRSGVTVNIPISAFLYGKDPITIEVIEEAAEKNSLSKTFVFKITQGSKVISQFEQGITLTFEVDRSLAQNVNNLKVFYFNEEKGVWENIGGSYNGGKVTVVTNHFSKFAVFEVAGNDPTSNTIVEIIKTDNNNNHVPGNKSSNDTAQSEESSNKPISSNNGSTTRLPETATNLYAFLLIGVLLCLGGASAIILNRRVARVTR
ncbi:hypothetical protein SAMN04488134_11392 [Amphibacillus marinus]|uniref:LPXTG-motif cell wall anchor domain-containing protein n=2 Tax=Amphibacillus marinus TaxID=872970 RepID=A0A1H8SSB3_9BACI|nr:hypothetical protein SAMN04488134_11392 [Amphibacillus marinus]